MDEFFLAVAIVTLLLGGIGVMNIMLVAVKERTREIGVRKAIGATAGRIQCQFFAEGLLLTGLSGLIGFAIGMGLCALVNLAPMPGAVPRDDRHLAARAVRGGRAHAHRRGRVDVSGAARRRS